MRSVRPHSVQRGHLHNGFSYSGCCCCCCNYSSSVESFQPHSLSLHQYPVSHQSQGHFLQPRLHPLQVEEQDRYQSYQHASKHFLRRQDSFEIVSSLLRRVDALEISLRGGSRTPFHFREAAARIIQAHFRTFLVRRSRTLAQLKELAFIRSRVEALKSIVFNRGPLDSAKIFRSAATGLLPKLDCLQGSDQLVQNGKKVISAELIQFLEFLDGVSSRRQEASKNDLRCTGSSLYSKKPVDPLINKAKELLNPRSMAISKQKDRVELESLNDDSDEQQVSDADSDSLHTGSDGTTCRKSLLPLSTETVGFTEPELLANHKNNSHHKEHGSERDLENGTTEETRSRRKTKEDDLGDYRHHGLSPPLPLIMESRAGLSRFGP